MRKIEKTPRAAESESEQRTIVLKFSADKADRTTLTLHLKGTESEIYDFVNIFREENDLWGYSLEPVDDPSSHRIVDVSKDKLYDTLRRLQAILEKDLSVGCKVRLNSDPDSVSPHLIRQIGDTIMKITHIEEKQVIVLHNVDGDFMGSISPTYVEKVEENGV